MSEIAYGNRMGFLIGGTDVNGYRRALHVSLHKKVREGWKCAPSSSLLLRFIPV